MSPLDSIRYHKSFLRTGFMSMDPRTGHVKAYVGGIDYNDFQYDMVNGGRRRIGSTIKPSLYSLAMIEGISPCDEMLHVQQRLTDENGRLWEPRNSNKKRIGEMVSVQWGLQNSDNWVTGLVDEPIVSLYVYSSAAFVRIKERNGSSSFDLFGDSGCLGW